MDKFKKAKDLVEPFFTSESLEEKIKRVKRNSLSLTARENDIREELKYAESLWLKRPKREVENWLEHVGQIEDKVCKAEQEAKVMQGKWFSNWQLPKKLDRLITEVEDLRRQGNFSQGLTIEFQESRGVTFPTITLVGQQFEANKKLILESLSDDNVLCIGIYGMGGVGKTTLLTHVNNELVQSFPDTSVAWVTVAENFRVHKLQEDIARALNFKLTCKEDERMRAAELWKFLERKKNLVLILDDVWEDIRLDKVGVFVRAKGCKLILTTRFKEVYRKMECNKIIEVNPLCVEESWELFVDKLGDDLMLTPQIDKVAKSLVRECAGLPLGIITIARNMKGVDGLFEWRNALETMKESKPWHRDIEIEVFQVLKHSYDMLKDPILQQCFLDCSLYPEDFKIKRDDLIDLFIDEGLINGMSSRQAEYDRGHTILNKLVNACLLENYAFYFEDRVKMHDLVRDMALQITSESPRFLVEASKGLRTIPDEEFWKEDLVKVSLMSNFISEIPSTFKPPKCPKLTTLLLRHSGVTRISDDFFLHMKGLVLLNLSNTYIEILPNSICELVNLSVLLLRHCWKLKCIPSLENLRELKKLDLYRSALDEVPHGLGDLIKLRHLNLLPNDSTIDKPVRGVKEKDIIRLRKLENLYCIFHDAINFNAYATSLQERGPTFYMLALEEVPHTGCPLSSKNVGDLSRTLVMRYLLVKFGGYPLLPPKCVEALFIEESIMEASSLCDVVSFRNVMNLRSLSISMLHGIAYLFSYSNTNVFQTIEVIYLKGMDNLAGLISGRHGLSSTHVTFSSLKKLRLVGHGNHCMERLFTNAWLPNLETVEVRGFNSLVEIISTTGGGNNLPVIITLPKLLELMLYKLQSLRSIAVISDVVKMVRICDCPNVRKIPLLDREQCPTSLQQVYIDNESMRSLEWNHPNSKDSIQSLINITAEKDLEEKRFFEMHIATEVSHMGNWEKMNDMKDKHRTMCKDLFQVFSVTCSLLQMFVELKQQRQPF